jgi:hypothetical protein
MAWKPVGQVFTGGTAAAQALYGKPIKVTRAFHGNAYDSSGQGAAVSLRAGEEGFVARVPPESLDSIVLAFGDGSVRPASIDALMRGSRFRTVLVNWITFKQQFQIDA